jgi:glycine cleavage system H protein
MNMSDIPESLYYSDSHEWARDEEDFFTIGITDHAQGLLGDLVYVELPEIGSQITAGDPVGVVESVKAASDIYCPISGEIIEINDSLSRSPEIVNSDPYNEGWLFKIKATNPDELDDLMSAEAYQSCIDED